MQNKGENSDVIQSQKLINNRKRVRKHGEVFTPVRIVNKMLDLRPINEACRNLTATFFEPGVGEGVFLVEILKRKLRMVEKRYGESLVRYENYSLLALSTLYGIELLDDNVKKSVMALSYTYNLAYLKMLKNHNLKPKSSVVKSARLIIAKNIVQGDFLTKLSAGGTPVVFSEWKPLNLEGYPDAINIQRTEYTLQDIESGIVRKAGSVINLKSEKGQIGLPFPVNDGRQPEPEPEMRYLPSKITLIHREEQEQVDG